MRLLAVLFLLSAAPLLADEGEPTPTPFVDRHGHAHASESVSEPAAPPSAETVGEIPGGANPNVDGFRGDRRARSIGYVEWLPRADVQGFLLEWSTSPSGPYYSVSDQPMQGRELLLRGMPAGEMVFVRIRTVFPNGAQGPWTPAIAIAPVVD